jgi:hypothetical protein
MTNRRRYHKDREHVGRHVRLPEYMLASPAWQSLDGNCRALYLELARRYRGPNSNNGKIPYSVREGATALHISKATANRALHTLIERGFARIGKLSGFNVKGHFWSTRLAKRTAPGWRPEPQKQYSLGGISDTIVRSRRVPP